MHHMASNLKPALLDRVKSIARWDELRPAASADSAPRVGGHDPAVVHLYGALGVVVVLGPVAQDEPIAPAHAVPKAVWFAWSLARGPPHGSPFNHWRRLARLAELARSYPLPRPGDVQMTNNFVVLSGPVDDPYTRSYYPGDMCIIEGKYFDQHGHWLYFREGSTFGSCLAVMSEVAVWHLGLIVKYR